MTIQVTQCENCPFKLKMWCCYYVERNKKHFLPHTSSKTKKESIEIYNDSCASWDLREDIKCEKVLITIETIQNGK